MKTVSRSKISSFMKSLAEQIPTMNTQGRARATDIIRQVPVTHTDIQSASHTDDNEFLDVLAVKFSQRYEDTSITLHQAVEQGVETIPELCSYLGIPEDSSVEEIVYRSHAHQRLSGVGKPQPESILD